ncbi:MAG: nicotinate-nucleotide--dimethylbenzimidazole phosphoribosyltransferase [Halonotius sp. J07HN6]|nr:MAG: nicotinate-nucleotide--dimethylbenzimidazole phosphoribosyltransferase [Halonotius sp. J07HN6]
MTVDAAPPEPPTLEAMDPNEYEDAEVVGDTDYRRDEIETLLGEGAWADAFEEWAADTDLDDEGFEIATDMQMLREFDFFWDGFADRVGYHAPGSRRTGNNETSIPTSIAGRPSRASTPVSPNSDRRSVRCCTTSISTGSQTTRPPTICRISMSEDADGIDGDSDADNEISVEIPPLDEAAREQARGRQDGLAKPPGSLGRLETMAAEIAAMQATPEPTVDPAVVTTLAADHGVAREGVSAYPQAVTTAMVETVADGGAAINAICAANDVDSIVVDMGVAGEPEADALDYRIDDGTANMVEGPAMSRRDARAAITAGTEIVADHAADAGMIGLGEMGIGNTTASAAITAALTGRPVDEVTGYGTGIDEETRARKIDTIERALAATEPDPDDPLDVLRCVGGFEIGGLVGVALAAAERRIPVVVDGVIAGAAALLAREIDSRVTDYLLGSHASTEPAHEIQLAALGLMPCIDYEMGLGEGTGAALAIGVYRSACRVQTGMATLDEIGVSTDE